MNELPSLYKSSATALYRQLANQLRQSIYDGLVPEGAQLPTEFELAANCGVSRGTVRQALGLLAEEGLIERVAGRGTFVRQCERPASRTVIYERAIGLIIPSANDQLSLSILIGAEGAAKRRGYQVMFNHSSESPEQEKEDLDRLLASRVAGAIVFPVSDVEYSETIWRLHESKFPLVLVDRYFPSLDCDYVVVDNLGGGYKATEHLISMGHTQIAFLHTGAGYNTTAVRDRYRGYRRALADYDLPFQETWASSLKRVDPVSGPEEVSAICASYLQRPDRLGAVFAANDSTAIGLISAATSLHLRVPDDLAVVGFDNMRMAAQVHPPLTTVHQPRVEIGIQAAQLLIDRIEGKDGPPEHIVLPTHLIVRDSCGARQRMQLSGA
jgi:DNA-binding LacI/PurR family transcriptional regulator